MSLRALLLGDATDPAVVRWARELAQRRWEVHVVSMQLAGIPGVEVHTLLPRFPGRLGRAMIVRQVRALVEELVPDVLHAFGAKDYGDLGLRADLKPLVVTVRADDVQALHRWRRGKLLGILRQADRILAPSHAFAHMVSTQLPGREVDVIPFGVDLSRFVPGEDPEVPTLGCILPLEAEGGQEFLLCAMRLIVQQNPERPLRLVIAGDGPDRDMLDQLSRELAMANRTTITEAVPESERPRFLRGLTVLVLPVLRDAEGYGLAAMQAASCGIPVVASWVGGLGEVVLDEVTGLLVPPRDPDMLAGAIARLLDDEHLRAEMGSNGRALMRKAYDWSQNADTLEGLYQDLVEGQPRTHDYLID